MKKFKNLFITIGVVLLGLLSYLYFLSINPSSAFENASSILRTFLSVATFIIAIYIYDRFGINKKLTAKRTELLIELLINLKALYFRIDLPSESIPIFVKKDIRKSYNEISDQYKNKKVIFQSMILTENIFRRINLIQNHPLIPKSIEEKLDFLIRRGGVSKTEYDDPYVAKIRFYFGEIDESEITQRWFIESGNDCTVEEYIKKYEILFIAIEKWISKYSELEDELNI